jgi:hypothetical protein
MIVNLELAGKVASQREPQESKHSSPRRSTEAGKANRTNETQLAKARDSMADNSESRVKSTFLRERQDSKQPIKRIRTEAGTETEASEEQSAKARVSMIRNSKS